MAERVAEGPEPQSDGGYGRGLVAILLVVSLIGTILGAGGTYAALRATGALNPTPAPAVGPHVLVQSESSTVIAAAAKVGPAAVQVVTNDGTGTMGVGSGIVYDSNGWVLTNRNVVEGAKTITVLLQDGLRLNGTAYAWIR